MSRHMVPVMLGLTVFPLAAIGIAAYLVVSAGPQLTAVAGAILLLSCCILVAATVALVKLSRHDDWLWSQQDALRGLAGKTEEALSRIAKMEKREAQALPVSRVDDMALEVGALRREVRDAMQAFRRPAPERDTQAEALTAPPPESEIEKEVERPQPAAAALAAGREQLTLMLEPVVELSTGTTTHYRALLALTDGRGQLVPHEELMQKADQGGMRPALDVRMVRMSTPVLRRLRQRNPGLRIFVPMGRATLSTHEEAGRLLALLQRDQDVAGGMVFEFAQQDLGRLDPSGIENLARLARSGATLALREVYVGGLDLAALRQLGVRFLSFPPHAVDAGSGPNANWNEFVANAKALQIQIVVGDIKTPQQATAASKFSRYGHGPFFAPPRKVRPDAGVAPGAARSAADVA